MQINYRKLIPSDISSLTELRIKQLHDGEALATCDLTLYLKEFYEKIIKDDSYIGFVAECNENIIATAGLSFVSKPPWYGNLSGKIGLLSSVFVEKPYRRRGIATDLVKLIIEEAKAQGCYQLHINASKDGLKLYRSLGFEIKDNFLVYNFN